MMAKHTLRQKGQAMSEYAIILALVAILAVIGLAITGVKLSSIYCGIVSVLGNTPTSCANGTLLQDAFDNLKAWSFPTGNGWIDQNGQLCATQSGERRGFTGQTDWSDYKAQIQQATLSQGNGYGLYFRVTNEPAIDGYVFQYDPAYGSFLIRKVTNGNETPPIAVAPVPAGFQWNQPNRTVSVDARGNTFTVSIDGKQVLQAQDSQYPTGRVGLRAWDDTQACFDNFSVTK